MIIYIISVVLLLATIGAYFAAPLEKRVMIMSILVICMIMLNFINQIDIIISPPVYGLLTVHGSYKVQRIKFTSNPFLQQKQQIEQDSKNKIQALNIHPNPLNKQEVKFMDKLKNSYYEDLIIFIDGLQQKRFQTLFMKFIDDVQNDQAKFAKKVKASVVQMHKQENQHKVKYVLPSLKDSEKNFIVLLQEPTLQLMSFLQSQYLSKSISIIFLKLPMSPLIHQLSKYIQILQLNPIYSQLFLKSNNLNIVEQCNKYRKLSYSLYLQSLTTPMIDLCSTLPSSLQTQCIKKFMKSQKDTIPFSLVKGCWIGQIPNGARVRNGFVTIDKDYYWAGKTDKSMFIIQAEIKEDQEL